MAGILDKLRGGDRRSIGRSEEVVREILRNPRLFSRVFEGMVHPDPVIRMRAADAIEKVTVERPDLLQPFKERILREVAAVDQKEVRWHVALILPRLRLAPREQNRALAILLHYLKDESKIVRTFSMQALADMALRNPAMRPLVVPQIEFLTRTGSPAMRSRGRKLLAKLAPVRD